MTRNLSSDAAYSNFSSQLLTPKRRSGRPVTFGVEIEAVLAFEQTLLQSVLDRYYPNPPSIVKFFPDSAHDCFLTEDDYSHTCRNLYPSWVLQVPIESDSDQSLQLVGQQSTSITGLSGKVRRYLAEPLIIAREVIGQLTIPVDVKAQLRRGADTISLGEQGSENSITLRAQSADYNRWTLTTDHTLIGSMQSQLQAAIGDRLFKDVTVTDPDGTTRTEREKQWDSTGFELVSPVFKFSDRVTAFSSITDCLEKLSQGTSHQTVTSVWASLQVHVGLDCQTPQDIPLKLLQHLAYILLTHEELISKLHPRNRSGLSLKQVEEEPQHMEDSYMDDPDEFDPDAPLPPEKTPSEIAAEDEEYRRQNDERVLQAEAKYTGHKTTNSNARWFCHITSTSYPPQANDIASVVFHPGITFPKLISLLQKPSTNVDDAAKGHRYRGYMYNFDNILTMYQEDTKAWKTGKPTIEFRQHACSIDPEEIRKWVELCFAIVKLAQTMAEKDVGSGIQAAGIYGAQWPCEGIEEFLGEDFVKLRKEDVEYWSGRFERYKNDRPQEEEIDTNMV